MKAAESVSFCEGDFCFYGVAFIGLLYYDHMQLIFIMCVAHIWYRFVLYGEHSFVLL